MNPGAVKPELRRGSKVNEIMFPSAARGVKFSPRRNSKSTAGPVLLKKPQVPQYEQHSAAEAQRIAAAQKDGVADVLPTYLGRRCSSDELRRQSFGGDAVSLLMADRKDGTLTHGPAQGGRPRESARTGDDRRPAREARRVSQPRQRA